MKLLLSSAIAVLLALALFALPGGTTTTAYAENVCGNDVIDVPDSGRTFDFTGACADHDLCYADGGSESDRQECDQEFLEAMLDSCEDRPRLQRFSCVSRAYTYYAGVRLGGWAFFPYSG